MNNKDIIHDCKEIRKYFNKKILSLQIMKTDVETHTIT